MYRIASIAICAAFFGCADKSENAKLHAVEVVESSRKENLIERMDNDFANLAKAVEKNKAVLPRGDVEDQSVALVATSALWTYFEIPRAVSRMQFDAVAALIGAARKRFGAVTSDLALFDKVVNMLDQRMKDPAIVAKFPYYGVYGFIKTIVQISTDPVFGINTKIHDSLLAVSKVDEYYFVPSLAADVVPLIQKVRSLLPENLAVGANAEKLVFMPLFVFLSHGEAIPLDYQRLLVSVLSAAVDVYEVLVTYPDSANAYLKDTLARINMTPKEMSMLQNIGTNAVLILNHMGFHFHYLFANYNFLFLL